MVPTFAYADQGIRAIGGEIGYLTASAPASPPAVYGAFAAVYSTAETIATDAALLYW